MKRHFQDWITSLVAVLPLACFIQLARKACQIHLTSEEISLITATVKQKRPCRFLVFGFGNDSMLWVKMNHHGKTIFLEDIPLWFDQIIKQHPHYNGYLLTDLKPAASHRPSGRVKRRVYRFWLQPNYTGLPIRTYVRVFGVKWVNND